MDVPYYKKVDIKNLEDNIYIAFIDELHDNIMIKLGSLLTANDIILYSQAVSASYKIKIFKALKDIIR
jgi:hypothetical protein